VGTGGNGGVGYQSSITGTSTYYAGGGAGAPVSGTAGTAGLGSGPGSYGGGASVTAGGGSGDAPTDGTIILRYSNTYDLAKTTTGSPTVTNTGGYRIYQWTGSGSITF
jgi:hypothetical protein